MYTRIRHPKTGAEVQIKTGDDACLEYRVGDMLSWEPDSLYPGQHIDGVYDGLGELNLGVALHDEKRFSVHYVVIKDCVVRAVHDQDTLDPQEDARLDPESDQYNPIGYFTERYEIMPPNPNLWTEEAWAAQRERQARSDAFHQKLDEEADAQGLKGVARVGYFFGKMMSERRNYASLARQIFQVEPMPAPSENIYFFGEPEFVGKITPREELKVTPKS